MTFKGKAKAGNRSQAELSEEAISDDMVQSPHPDEIELKIGNMPESSSFYESAAELSLTHMMMALWSLHLDPTQSREQFLDRHRVSLLAEVNSFVRSGSSYSNFHQKFTPTQDPSNHLSKEGQELLLRAVGELVIRAQVERTLNQFNWVSGFDDEVYSLACSRFKKNRSFPLILDDIVERFQKIEAMEDLEIQFKRYREAYAAIKSRLTPLEPSLIASIGEVSQEFIEYLAAHPDLLTRISWEVFEKLVAELFASAGFAVEFSARSRNKSADLFAIGKAVDGRQSRCLIECKRYSNNRKVGLAIVNQVLGAAVRSNVDHCFLVTTSSFSRDVELMKGELRQFNLHLRDGQVVVDWLRSFRPCDDAGLWIPYGVRYELNSGADVWDRAEK